MIRTRTTGFSKSLLVLLVLQHALVSVAAAGPFAGQSSVAATEVSGHCESMPSESMSSGKSGEHDMQLHDHQDCVESGCDECVSSAACMPVAFETPSISPGRQALILSVKLFSAPQPDFLYRPPIDC